jgi:hypothetical protein
LFLERRNEAVNKKQVWYSNDIGFGPAPWSGSHSVGRNSQASENIIKISGANHTTVEKSRFGEKLPGSVGEVVALLEGGKTLVNCDKEPEVCNRVDSCVTRYIWMEAATAMYERLAAITFADLLSMDANGCQKKFIDYLTSNEKT